jgi:hypothetical protein
MSLFSRKADVKGDSDSLADKKSTWLPSVAVAKVEATTDFSKIEVDMTST